MGTQMLYGLTESLSAWAVDFRRQYPILAAGDAVMTLMEDVVAPHGGVVRQGCLVELMELLGLTEMKQGGLYFLQRIRLAIA